MLHLPPWLLMILGRPLMLLPDLKLWSSQSSFKSSPLFTCPDVISWVFSDQVRVVIGKGWQSSRSFSGEIVNFLPFWLSIYHHFMFSQFFWKYGTSKPRLLPSWRLTNAHFTLPEKFLDKQSSRYIKWPQGFTRAFLVHHQTYYNRNASYPTFPTKP